MDVTPCKVDLEKDKIYFWCACGLSAKNPFCDGSHKNGSGKKSFSFKQEKTTTVFLCNCKNTKNPPYCDGSHKSL